MTLKMGLRSPKSNQHFPPSQWYIYVSLAKVCPFNKEIECGQEATPTPTPTPTGSALKTICSPPSPPPPPMEGGHNKCSHLKHEQVGIIRNRFYVHGFRRALTHKSLASHKGTLANSVERAVWSGSPLFALTSEIPLKHSNDKNWPDNRK